MLLLDEPTRGIDVGAKLEVYELINRLTAQGKAIVLVSSELGELIGMSDRIVMLHEGRIGGEFTRAEATQERLLAAAMGREPGGMSLRKVAHRANFRWRSRWSRSGLFFAWQEPVFLSPRNLSLLVDRARRSPRCSRSACCSSCCRARSTCRPAAASDWPARIAAVLVF